MEWLNWLRMFSACQGVGWIPNAARDFEGFSTP